MQRRAAVRRTTGIDANSEPFVAANGIDLFEEVEYRRFLVNRALITMKAEFPEHTWQACWKLVVEGLSGAEVAKELGISENDAYVSKSRVLRRLRAELADLLD